MASKTTAQSNPISGPFQRPENRFPPRFTSASRRAGFALIAVIWSLGLVTLLGTAVIVGARYRTKLTSSSTSTMAAAAAAESGVDLGIALVLAAVPGQKAQFPLSCRMPGGEQVTISVEEEAGKVDLNTATPAVLARFFTALTQDQSIGSSIADRIVAFRNSDKEQAKDNDTRSSNGAPANAKKARFTTILQLDQIDGLSPHMFRAALRFVTVRSGRPEPDPDAASPILRKFLNLVGKPVDPARPASASGTVTIRADVTARDGARFIREALVSLGPEDGKPFLIREWRRGDRESGASAATTRSEDSRAENNSCIGGAVGS